MILTDKQIRDAVNTGVIQIEPFTEKDLQPASYDFHIGNEAVSTSLKKKIDLKKEGFFSLEAGDFAFVITDEIVELDAQHTGRIGLRSYFSRKGITATTGPQIDPGYRGRLIIGLMNLTPTRITLTHKEKLLTVEFHKLEEPVESPYHGDYQGKMNLGAEEIAIVTEKDGLALPEMMKMLGSLSQNVARLSDEVKNLKWLIPIIMSIGMAVIGIIVSLK